MTNDEVKAGFCEVYNEFWNRYKERQPGEDSAEWERIHTRAAMLRRKYPFMEGVINRMLTEMIERMRGRGNQKGDFHGPRVN